RDLGSDEVWRLKLGVGRPPGRQEPADFVLRRFAKRERPDVDLMVVEAAEVVRSFAAEGG
ncbi:MAG: aminoacyl-tRNA hydrolase, partial [Actinobacteria bacterium]|nr:aminoacyl-tRNA hydrolase [Actinomycetota bacterium]NIU18742.1 aminoacyl-tRNA hydrolase [Actinomycetota bacterium]NIV86602.1 aminoacyl-tRNA hydrolase [Actinomycetota bacterium]